MAWTDANAADLGERRLDELSNEASGSIFGDDLIDVYASDIHDLIQEIRRHRAMVKRLEEWAEQLDEPGKGRALARELRNRMKGE